MYFLKLISLSTRFGIHIKDLIQDLKNRIKMIETTAAILTKSGAKAVDVVYS